MKKVLLVSSVLLINLTIIGIGFSKVTKVSAEEDPPQECYWAYDPGGIFDPKEYKCATCVEVRMKRHVLATGSCVVPPPS